MLPILLIVRAKLPNLQFYHKLLFYHLSSVNFYHILFDTHRLRQILLCSEMLSVFQKIFFRDVSKVTLWLLFRLFHYTHFTYICFVIALVHLFHSYYCIIKNVRSLPVSLRKSLLYVAKRSLVVFSWYPIFKLKIPELRVLVDENLRFAQWLRLTVKTIVFGQAANSVKLTNYWKIAEHPFVGKWKAIFFRMYDTCKPEFCGYSLGKLSTDYVQC